MGELRFGDRMRWKDLGTTAELTAFLLSTDCAAKAGVTRTGGDRTGEVLSSRPTIDPADELFQSLDFLLDPWLCKRVIIL